MTFPVIFRGRNNITTSGPQPTGDRRAALGQGNATDILTVAAANFDLQPFTKWHAFAWVYFDVLPDLTFFTTPINQGGDVANDATFAMAVVNFGNYVFAVPLWAFDGLNNIQFTALALDFATNFGDVQTGTWYLVDWWIDYDTLEIGVRVNGDSVLGKTTDVFTGTSPTTVDDLRTFSPTGGVLVNETPFAGRLGGCAFRGGSLWTDAEMQYIYNEGCQILYGEMNTGLFPTVLDDIYAWWDMQEGTGADRTNAEGTASRDLLNNGSVPQTCGTCWVCTIDGADYAASFPGTLTDYLSCANADFVIGGETIWHACGWVRFNSISLSPGDKVPIIGQFDDTAADTAFQMYLTEDGSGPVLAFAIVSNDGSDNRFDILATTFRTNYGNILAGTWYFWDAWYDGSVSQLAQLRINDAADGADALFMGGSPGVTGTSPYDLLLGEFSGGAAGPVLDGYQSSVAFRVGSRWDDTQMAYIYNAGCGVQFGDMANGPAGTSTNLYTFWNMSEISGTRVNNQGTSSRDLLETGTVNESGGPCVE